MDENIIIKDFELGAILSIITGYSCVDDFSKVFELVWFVCDDNMINTFGLGVVKNDIKNHLLAIHPELKNVKYRNSKGRNIHKFLSKQEEKFGSILPITQLGVKLPKEYRSKNLSYIPLNDSEVIVDKLDGFNYDQSSKSVKTLKKTNNK